MIPSISNLFSPQAANEVDVAQAFKMNNDGALLLDVREPNEFSMIHAPNSMIIPLSQVQSRFGEIAAYKKLPIAVI